MADRLPNLFWTAAGLLLLGARTLCWAIYRPVPALAREDAPSITVIVPAYNEGAMVMQAITSIVEADYPRDRIEIIAIDDGSKDDTWDYISAAAQRYPGLVTALRQDCNRGKREAMALAIGRARGDIFVTVDSDSVIERGALLAIVAPFNNPRVGAVAGKVLVYNRKAASFRACFTSASFCPSTCCEHPSRPSATSIAALVRSPRCVPTWSAGWCRAGSNSSFSGCAARSAKIGR